MGLDEARRSDVDDATDAFVDGDQALAPGGARAALRHRDFRVVWGGTFASNIGTWMQNVLLGAYGYELTHSAGFVGVLFFAQLGPLLFLATLGGVLADIVDRRKLLIWAQLEQLAFSLVLAALVATPNPSRVLIVACVLVIGIGNALSAPALSAILPTLVPRQDLTGAVSLQSVQMNLSRVIGPAIGSLIYATTGAATVFTINAGTYLFAIAGLLLSHARMPRAANIKERGLARLTSGFRIAARDRLVKRILIGLATFSFFSVTFVGLMPAIAATNFGIRAKSVEYGLLYAGFGFGAAAGAVSVGTIFVHRSKSRSVRIGLFAFAVLLALFAVVRARAAAYPIAIALGYAYFVVITSLSTVLQAHLRDEVRGRVMALWIMAFGGTVPLGVLVGGYAVRVASLTTVLLIGAFVAFGLIFWIDLAGHNRPG
jgi:MFS family permease